MNSLTTPSPHTTKPRSRRHTARFLALGSAGAVGLRMVMRRHNASLRAAANALNETVSAPGTFGEPQLPDQGDTAAHARGHRHMGPDPSSTTDRLAHRTWRRWTQRADRTNHPPRA